MNRTFWWVGPVLSALLAFVGAAGFNAFVYTVGPSGLGFLWPIGALIGAATGFYMSRLFKRLRTRAILPVMNGIISLVILFQLAFWTFAFIPTDTSANFGFALLVPLLTVSVLSFWRRLAVPLWVICHEAINLVTLIVVDFSWWYWSQSFMSNSSLGASCMNVPALTRVDSMYFTLTTLATVGYGDIHPMSATCREGVSWQIIASFVFVVFIVALLVSRIGEGTNHSVDDAELIDAIRRVQERLENISKDVDDLRVNLKAGASGQVQDSPSGASET